MALPVSFRWDEGFVARIDAARGDVPRSVFVRRAVERALSDGDAVVGPSGPVDAEKDVVQSPSPAEQPEGDGVPFAPVGDWLRETRPLALREFRPYPKGGKR